MSEGSVEFTVGPTGGGEDDAEGGQMKRVPSKGGLKPVRSVARFRVEFIGDDPEAPPETSTDGDDQNEDDDDEMLADDYNQQDTVDNLPLSKGQKRVRVRPTSTSSNDRNSVSSNYDTKNLKTFGRNTLEALPHLDHYRNLLSATGALRQRPTLYELHDNEEEENDQNRSTSVPLEKSQKEIQSQGPKFGWIKGVLVRCLLNIWGVMLFLRLSWVVGQSGIGLAVVIILLSAVVTVITTLSMSAICTNGEVKGGGAYYMISRSLGPEFGGAIGLIFSLANAVAVAMYVVGFAETIRDIIKEHGRQMVDDVNDVRIIGIVTVICLLGVVLVGMDWEARAQVGLLVILIIAIVDFIIGVFIPPTTSERAKGFVGIKDNVIAENFGPDFRGSEGFFSVFSVFFPAATGILAGANISGDLKDAQQAIPKGTLLAILITTLTYIGMAILVGMVVQRDASGLFLTDILNSSIAQAQNESLVNPSGFVIRMMNVTADNLTLNAVDNQNHTIASCVPGSCKFGLQNHMGVMNMVSGWGPLILAGIICATLSSALASLVGAPKVFQAVCKDRIFPGIHVFAKGYGKGQEPVRAYVLAFFIAMGCICIGSLNAIAPLISNFFLISYALINYSCFDASLAKSPGWRPAFKYYSMWLSLLGALLCLAVMFVINWWTALITFAVVTGLYLYVHYSKPEINWGSSTQAHQYRNALTSSLKLQYVEEHVKNFRPQTLVLTGHPSERPALVDFVNTFTKNICLMVCGHVVRQMDENESLKDMRTLKSETLTWLRQRKVKAFYNPIMAGNLRSGVQGLMQCSGVGKMRPNFLMLGMKSNWGLAKPEEVDEYFNIIHDAFDLRYGVGILRLPDGFRVSHILDSNDCEEEIDILIGDNVPTRATPSRNSSSATLDRFQVSEALNGGSKLSSNNASETDLAGFKNQSYLVANVASNGTKHVLANEHKEGNGDATEVSSVTLRVPQIRLNADSSNYNLGSGNIKGTIDVWWLFDDGGLTLLLPYLLTKKSHWKNCKLRIFSAASKASALDRDQRHMATLLSKFRINYHDMTIIPDVGKKPKPESLENFEQMLKPWMVNTEAGETQESHPWKVSLVDISTQTDRTHRHLRCRELLMEHSMDAQLIVMTLPMPRKGIVSSGLYMAYLDTLTKGMPPILLLRGNQESVLTYYS